MDSKKWEANEKDHDSAINCVYERDLFDRRIAAGGGC